MGYDFQWSLVFDRWPLLLAGAWIDVQVTLMGFALACVVGLIVAMLRYEGNILVSVPAIAYLEVARGMPPYVFLLWVHFGLAALLDFRLTSIQSITFVLAFTGSGYTAEIFRAGIMSIERGQVEAAKSLGISPPRIYGDVILPQAMRVVVPPLGNVLIGLLKGATLMSVIAIPDMMHVAQEMNMNEFIPFEAFTSVLVVFVGLVSIISLLFVGIERALAHP